MDDREKLFLFALTTETDFIFSLKFCVKEEAMPFFQRGIEELIFDESIS